MITSALTLTVAASVPASAVFLDGILLLAGYVGNMLATCWQHVEKMLIF
jgi:hypothetical protein